MELKKTIKGIAGLGAVAGIVGGVGFLSRRSLKETEKRLKKQSSYYALSQQWITNKNEGKTLDSYFKEQNYNTIAIYGMGTLGELFLEEIKKSDLKVAYFIDKNSDDMFYGESNIEVTDLEGIHSKDDVDVVVITPIFDFDEIMDELQNAGISCPMVSLEEIIYDI